MRFLIILIAITLLFAGCGRGSAPNSTNNSSTPSEPTPATTASPSPQTAFEKDLQFIRNGSYTYIYIITRKDGKPLEPADSAFLRTNAPQIVDWASTDGKKVVAGTNFNLEEGNLGLLKKRFNVEAYTGQ
jgi:hypothetical protein